MQRNMQSVRRGEQKYHRRMKQVTYSGTPHPKTKKIVTRPLEKDLGGSKQPKITIRFKRRGERAQVRTELSDLRRTISTASPEDIEILAAEDYAHTA